jgi:AraC-like DNA-binding protein
MTTIEERPTAIAEPSSELPDGQERAARTPGEHVAVADLRPGATPRISGEDEAHARLLAVAPGPLPPILVHRPTMTVIDGMHRLIAATLRGDEEIAAVFFEGSLEDAFVEGVRSNVAHGKPLTLQDREAAAKRILATHHHWSDRAIAEVCAMSPKTVARIRRAILRDGPPARVGRDGRIRPVDGSSARLHAAEIIRSQPDASIREVARIAGTSSGTVRDVRRRLTEGRHPLPDRTRGPSRRRRASAAATDYEWANDPALYSDAEDSFISWFDDRNIVTGDWASVVPDLPLSRLYLLSDECRARAEQWEQFASALEGRVQSERANLA